jgi:hypothetical protein
VTLTLSDGRDTTVLQAAVHVQPYTPPGTPSVAALVAVAVASVLVIVAALAVGGLHQVRAARRSIALRHGGGDPPAALHGDEGEE